MTTLGVSGWPQGNRTDRAGFHCVVVVLVCLDVRAEWDATVLLEVHGAASDDFAWAKGIVHAILGSKIV